MHGVDDFLQFVFRIFRAHFLQHLARFVNALLCNQPAWALRNAEEHHEKQKGWNRRYAELPSPFCGTQADLSDREVRQVREQNADHDVDLKHANEPTADFCGSQFGDVYRTEHRGAADAEAAEKARQKQSLPIPGKGAAQRREHVEDGEHAQRFSCAVFLARNAGGHRAYDRTDQRHGNGQAKLLGRKAITQGQRMRRAGDDRGIEAEEQATKGADRGGFEQGSSGLCAPQWLAAVSS